MQLKAIWSLRNYRQQLASNPHHSKKKTSVARPPAVCVDSAPFLYRDFNICPCGPDLSEGVLGYEKVKLQGWDTGVESEGLAFVVCFVQERSRKGESEQGRMLGIMERRWCRMGRLAEERWR